MAKARDSNAWPGVRDCTRFPLFRLFVRTTAPAKRTDCSAAGHLHGVSMREGAEATQTALALEQELFAGIASIKPWQWSAQGLRLVHSALAVSIKLCWATECHYHRDRSMRWAPAPALSIKLCRRSGVGEPIALSMWCLNLRKQHAVDVLCLQAQRCSLWSIAGDRIEHDRPLILAQYNVLVSGSPHGSVEAIGGRNSGNCKPSVTRESVNSVVCFTVPFVPGPCR